MVKEKFHRVRRWVMPALAALAVIVLSGCSFLQSGLDGEDQRSELITKSIVGTGTIRLIDGDAAKQTRIIDTADTILDYMEKNPEGRAADIAELVKDSIPWSKLTAEENYLITTLLAVVQADIEQQIQDGVVSEELLLRVKTIVKWVRDAAKGVTIPTEVQTVEGLSITAWKAYASLGGLAARPIEFGNRDTWEDITTASLEGAGV